jgi:hypothetical protein
MLRRDEPSAMLRPTLADPADRPLQHAASRAPYWVWRKRERHLSIDAWAQIGRVADW